MIINTMTKSSVNISGSVIDILRQVSISGSFINDNTIARLTFSNIYNGLNNNSSAYLYVGYDENITTGFELYLNKNCSENSKITISEDPVNVKIGTGNNASTIKMLKFLLTNKLNGYNEIYIKNNLAGGVDIDKFYVLVVCKNTIISTSTISQSNNSLKKIITNGNNPILCWRFKLKTTEGYGVMKAKIFIDDDSASNNMAYLGLCKDVTSYVKRHEPLYISHPNINLLYGIEDTSINNTAFDVFVEYTGSEAPHEKTKVTVIPKILTVNLVELTFEIYSQSGGRNTLTPGEHAYLAIRETFTNVSVSDTFDEQYVFDHLYDLPYTQFFWKKTDTTYTESTLEIINFDFYNNFSFNIVQESKNYYAIKEEKNLKFNYFYHIVQPKTWENTIINSSDSDRETLKDSAKDFYMYYALFATCYCDKDGAWYLYFNPGGYLVSNEITIGLSVMSLNGEHKTLEYVTLSKEINDSSLVYTEAKTLNTYVEYGNVDSYVTLYDNFTDSVLTSDYDTDGNEIKITNIAEDILKYDNTKLYIDDKTNTGLMIYKNEMNENNVFEAHDGDLAYTSPILYNAETGKYSIVLYSKQFSLLFDRNITKDDIKEISIIGPINYNLTNQTTNRSFEYVQLNYEVPNLYITIDDSSLQEISYTTSSLLYKKILAQIYNNEWQYTDKAYIYICGFYRESQNKHIIKVYNSYDTYTDGSEVKKFKNVEIFDASAMSIKDPTSYDVWNSTSYDVESTLSNVSDDFKVISIEFNTNEPPKPCVNGKYSNDPTNQLYTVPGLYIKFTKENDEYEILKYDITDLKYFDEK